MEILAKKNPPGRSRVGCPILVVFTKPLLANSSHFDQRATYHENSLFKN